MLQYPRDMKDNNVAPSTMRARKSKAKAAKFKSAQAQGITIVEGGILAYKGKDFVVYQWDEAEKDYVVMHRGKLD